MKFTELGIQGLWLVEPVRHGDTRGYFCEAFRKDLFDLNIGSVEFVQDNESVSSRGVLRGLHLQQDGAAQAKLVRVSRGAVWDVAVDLRAGSPDYGRWIGVELSAENGRQLFIPRGFAHGFLVLSDEAQFQYKVDAPYCPSAEMTVRWDDADLDIKWPLCCGMSPVVSAKDAAGVAFADVRPQVVCAEK